MFPYCSCKTKFVLTQQFQVTGEGREIRAVIWVFHLPDIYSAWKAPLLTKNMEEGKNRQYLANYLHDNSESENIQDANIELSHLK